MIGAFVMKDLSGLNIICELAYIYILIDHRTKARLNFVEGNLTL